MAASIDFSLDKVERFTYYGLMDHKEIRRKFIEFFVNHGHLEVPSNSLVPDYDPTLLLTNSGMAPLKPYFLGLAKPPSRRITNVQRCLRTNDIESVGDIHHLTFFEMMGNWSIGDPEAQDGIGPSGYFKKEAINFAWDLLSEFGIDRTRIWAGVFGGDRSWLNVPPDEESFTAWKNFLPEERILKLPSKDSFWFSGPSGPCGPNTDILYDLGPEHSCGKPDCGPNCDCGRFLEIWNAGVFMMYNRMPDGSFKPLPAKSVDAGAGLERFAMVLQDVGSVYETDIFKNLIGEINALAEVGHTVEERSVRIIADHTRAVSFLASDGVVPSNTERGYVMRRLIRRAILHGLLLNINGYFLSQLSESVIDQFGDIYPLLLKRRHEILKVIEDEERTFGTALKRGLHEFEKLLRSNVSNGVFSGQAAFRLYDSYGFPLELSEELSRSKSLSLDKVVFEELLKKQKERSRQRRTGEEFDPSKIKTAHTAAHLLNRALQEVLGGSVHQMGQRLSQKQFTHDFNFPRRLTSEELRKIEGLVNEKILGNLPVTVRETSFEEAKKEGAQAQFEEKYKSVDKVTLYEIGNFSRELCGGPHAQSTGQLKKFKIVKEEAVSAGIRRIKAGVEG